MAGKVELRFVKVIAATARGSQNSIPTWRGRESVRKEELQKVI